MKFAQTLALAALTAFPAMADPAEDYARLREAMPTLLLGSDTTLQLRLQAEVIKRLEGRWIQVSALMTDGVTFPDRDQIATGCKRSAFEVEPDGMLGLTMATPTKSDPYVIRLRYAGGTTYLSTIDEAGAMARLFPGKTPADLKPEMLYSTFVTSGWSGFVTVNPAGDDLVLIQPQGRQPEMLARCP
jgi:hypothetical protein